MASVGNFRFLKTISLGFFQLFDVLCMICIISCFTDHVQTVVQERKTLFEQFYDFAVHYKKPYLSNSSELMFRFKIFKENVAVAEQLNIKYNHSQMPVYGANKFADLTLQEFKAQYLSGLRSLHSAHNLKSNSLPITKPTDVKLLGLPKKVDWRERNVLTYIKDQRSCGGCWSFSIVETMESMFAIQYNTTAPELSVQELIDCDTGNNGCSGGDICEAAEWAVKNGVVNETMYPLTDRTDQCRKLPGSPQRVHIKTYSCGSFKGKETDLLNVLANHGPVAVAIDAETWHNYVGGVIQFHCSDHVNHAVQIVGYDLTGEVPFYIVRNSWGTDFGDKGFLYIKYGSDLCGLTSEVAKVTVK